MTGLAPPHERWDAETATPPVLDTLAAAGYRVVRWLVSADTPRLEPWYGSKDGCCAPSRQVGSWWGASALRGESEMDEFDFGLGKKRRVDRDAIDLQVWKKSEGRCWYCGVDLLLPSTWKGSRLNIDIKVRLYVDHFHSQRAGGGDEFENLVPACLSCNSAKGPRDIEDFRWILFFKQQGILPITKPQRDWLTARSFVFDGYTDIRFWFEEQGLSP
jgi:5-methylcytosine-specific restriction endonuclease McrA